MGPWLGFEVVTAGEHKSGLRCTDWTWYMERPDGAQDYIVRLVIHDDPDTIQVGVLRNGLHPYEHQATAPNLVRLAVVSSPVTDLNGDRVDEKLNAKLVQAL